MHVLTWVKGEGVNSVVVDNFYTLITVRFIGAARYDNNIPPLITSLMGGRC